MTLRHYMLVFGFGTLVAFAAWIMVLVNIDPVSTGAPSLMIFLVILFAVVVGFFTTIGTLVRGIRFKKRDVEDVVKTSLRQGVLLGLLVVAALLLLRAGAFTWWTLLIAVLLLGGVEFLALQTASNQAHRSKA